MTSTQQQLAKAQREAEKRKLRDALILRLKAHKIRLPIFEYQFDPDRRWRMDMAWPRDRLLVELHGGIYTQGRHVRPIGFEKDREKMNAGQLAGFRVLEFTMKMITSGYAERAIAQALPEAVLKMSPLPKQGRRRRAA